MKHFSEDDNLNVFRLPVAWQYLTDNDVGSSLNEANLGLYDELVQGCLGTGALCIVDVRGGYLKSMNFSMNCADLWNLLSLLQIHNCEPQPVLLWFMLAKGKSC